MALERENRTLDAILVAPISRTANYIGKLISVSLFVLILEAILVIVFIVFFNKPYYRTAVLLILMLGTIGYLAAGVLVTSMTIQTRSREVLLPVLLLPLSLPLVLPAALAVSALVFPQLPTWGEIQSAVLLVILYDLLMVTIGTITYHYVVEF